jgi:hypothetical protein
MPNIKKPYNWDKMDPAAQERWMADMEELQRQSAEIAAETAATNKKRAVPGTERRRQKETKKSTTTETKVAPSAPSGPSIPGTIDVMRKRQQMLQGLKKGGPVRKKPAAKKAPAKKSAAKGVAKRGMGRAMMRGR